MTVIHVPMRLDAQGINDLIARTSAKDTLLFEGIYTITQTLHFKNDHRYKGVRAIFVARGADPVIEVEPGMAPTKNLLQRAFALMMRHLHHPIPRGEIRGFVLIVPGSGTSSAANGILLRGVMSFLCRDTHVVYV